MADWIQDCSGECYAAPQEKQYVQYGYLMKKQEDEPRWVAEIPDEVQAITAWWDVQGDYITGLVVGWGYQEECWLIERPVKFGDATTTDVLKSIQDYTKKTYRKSSGFEMGVLLSGVDAGYKPDSVNAICEGQWKTKIIPTYGDASLTKPVIVGATKTKKKRDNFGITICSNAAKDIVYARYRTETPGPGYIHIPESPQFDESFIKELVAERRGIKKNDPMRWVCPDGVRNEALDQMVGNLAIVMMAQQRFRLRFLPPHEHKDEVIKEPSMNFESLKDVFGR
jgi:phage terminase large subunit GpA-like protein